MKMLLVVLGICFLCLAIPSCMSLEDSEMSASISTNVAVDGSSIPVDDSTNTNVTTGDIASGNEL